MLKGDNSIRDGIEDFLCPFTDVYITQSGNSSFSHKGTYAFDIRGKVRGVRYPYYAPFDLKCIKVYKDYGQALFQSLNKVRFANGRINYATFLTAHDDNMVAYKNKIFRQGEILGHMGMKGNATGVHCHIEIEEGRDLRYYKNKYGVYMLNNEISIYDAFFIDNTNILNGNYNFKYKNSINISTHYLNLPPTFSRWRVYHLGKIPIKKNACGFLNPRKFNGLSYKILGFMDNNSTCVIETRDYGRVKIYIKKTKASISSSPLY